jgi:nucleoid-associated protein YgaU
MKLNNIEVLEVKPYLGDSVMFFLANETTTVLSRESITLKTGNGELEGYEAHAAPVEEAPEVPAEEAPAEEAPEAAAEKPKRKKKSE